jgi:hypothetical protein
MRSPKKLSIALYRFDSKLGLVGYKMASSLSAFRRERVVPIGIFEMMS